ncbi:threonine aldolase family protein [Virgibacillus kimchii]
MMNMLNSFYSDNTSGAHQEVLDAINKANQNDVPSYGDDLYTASAISKFKEQFGDDIDVFFVLNGTAANVLALKAMTASYNSIICAKTAHLNVNECGSPEQFTGCKITPLPTKDGKLTSDIIKKHLKGFGNKHYSQPKVISISQPTEFGTTYKPEEIKSIAALAKDFGMLLHMDGARLANAAAYLDVSLKELTADSGVDVLSFGGTKNGLMMGEAVVFLNRKSGKHFQYIQKQGMQLSSKMRFIGAQFEALLTDDLWLRNARNANEMAQLLSREVSKVPNIKVSQKVEANMVIADVPQAYVKLLQEKYKFIVQDESRLSSVRWMTSFDTTEIDVYTFIQEIKDISNDW